MPQLNQGDVASALQTQGEKALLNGDLSRGLDCFDKAIQKDPNNQKLFYKQGLALFDYGREEGREKAMLLASKKFKSAITLCNDDFDTWQAWGSVLSNLGMYSEEHHYFLDAKEKFIRALFYSEGQDFDALSDLYWDIGMNWFHLALQSGEAMDMHQAIEAYQKSHEYEENMPADFWKDYGEACLNFAGHMNDIRFYTKAISCLKQALSLDSAHCESWQLLAEALQKLYFITHDEDHFNQANECYASATQLEGQESQIWLDWAAFLCDSAKRVVDIKRLRYCIEKCQKAFALDPEDPMIQAIWAEALALLGNYTDRLDLIYEAQNKVSQAIEKEDLSPEIWYSYGICMQTLGHYFNDHDYYYQAIEKFQEGLSIDRTCHKHWHAIGWTYSFLGDAESDTNNLELSLRFFKKAIDLTPSTYYMFDYAVAMAKLGEITRLQSWFEQAVEQFEHVINTQKNAVYLHPDWLFHYACTLDALGDFHEEEFYYLKAIEIFSHILMVDPDFGQIHHRIALALCHLGELMDDIDAYFRSVHHFRIAAKNEEENDVILLDWSSVLINIAILSPHNSEKEQFFQEAEYKLMAAMRLGNLHSYYHLACLHSLTGYYEKAMGCIEKARQSDALPPMEEVLQDEWLEDLRSTEAFQAFLTQLEHRRNYQEEC